MNKNQTLEELSERVMTIEEAAEYLKIKKGTLQNWLSQEKFGFKKVKLASKTFVDRDQVEAFLSEALEAWARRSVWKLAIDQAGLNFLPGTVTFEVVQMNE